MQFKVMPSIIGLLLSVAASSSEADDDATWNRLKPYFESRAEFAQQFGKYSSPLKFYDGGSGQRRCRLGSASAGDP